MYHLLGFVSLPERDIDNDGEGVVLVELLFGISVCELSEVFRLSAISSRRRITAGEGFFPALLVLFGSIPDNPPNMLQLFLGFADNIGL